MATDRYRSTAVGIPGHDGRRVLRYRLAALAGAAFAVGIVFSAMACSSSSAFRANSPPVIRSIGLRTLDRLGYPDQVVPTEADVDTRSVSYRLLQRASQGPKHWYLIHFHFRITFSEAKPDGFAVVTASTNGRAASQILFTPEVDAAGSPRIRWRTLDFIRGREEHLSSSDEIEVRNVNFLQYRGVRGGRNSLSFQLEQGKSVHVESLVVLSDTAIEYSKVGPAKIGFSVRSPKKVAVGTPFSVSFTLTRHSSRLPLNVELVPQIIEGSASALGSETKHFAQIRRPIKDSFRFRVDSPGAFTALIFLKSPSSNLLRKVHVNATDG